MIPIHLLLSRFKKVANTEKEKKLSIINEFKKRNIHINLQNIYFSKNTIIIRVSPIIKTEIILIKKEVIEELKKIDGIENFTDIL